MHTYSEGETYVSLVHTMPNLTGWSLATLLDYYGHLAINRRDAIAAGAPELGEIERDLSAIADEIESRTTSPVEKTYGSGANTYVRHTMDRLTKETCKPGQDSSIWDVVHLLSIVTTLDVRGYGAAVRDAADEQCRSYGLPAQSEVDVLSDPRCTVEATDEKEI